MKLGLDSVRIFALCVLLTACGSDSAPKDTDGDGIPDSLDNCLNDFNSDQLNTDGDALGNECDSDMDGDGVDNEEDELPLDPDETVDSDGDGIGDGKDLAINNPDTTYIELDRLIETNKITTIFEGSGLFDRLGLTYDFQNVGDTNGDGKDDLAVIMTGEGEYTFDTEYWTGNMHVHLILGGTPLPAMITKENISELATVTFVVTEDNAEDERDFGDDVVARTRIAPSGDLNNDGLSDFTIVSEKNNVQAADDVNFIYYVYGRETWPVAQISQFDIPDTYGFTLHWGSEDLRGYVDHFDHFLDIGDVNGDGWKDIALKTRNFEQHQYNNDDSENPYLVTAPYILFGNTVGIYGELDMETIATPIGTKLQNSDNVDRSQLGTGIIPLGDINGDDIGDIAITDHFYNLGTDFENEYGRIYMMYGKQQWDTVTDLSTFDPNDGQLITGFLDQVNGIGYPVIYGSSATGGDLNGDGLNDVLYRPRSFKRAEDDWNGAGALYMLWGGSEYSQFNVNVYHNQEEIDWFIPEDHKGWYFAPSQFIPDINSDGTSELIIGAPNYEDIYTNSLGEMLESSRGGRGGVYLIFGSAPFYENFDWYNLQPGQGYFIHNSNGDIPRSSRSGSRFGRGVGTLGDWNNNGRQLIYMTMPYYNDIDADMYEEGNGRVFLMELADDIYENVN